MSQDTAHFTRALDTSAKFFRVMLNAGVTLPQLFKPLDNKAARENLRRFLAAGCPEIKFVDGQTMAVANPDASDDAVFFQTRDALWVGGDLVRYIGFGADWLEKAGNLVSIDLAQGTREADLFGKPGTPAYHESLRTAVALRQIRQKIEAQWRGIVGTLLNDGRANLFPVKGYNGELHVVDVLWNCNYRKWRVDCNPLSPGHVRCAGQRIFRNT